jgi:hypothetical protein
MGPSSNLSPLRTGFGGHNSRDAQNLLPPPKFHGGQLKKIYGQQNLIWEHPKTTVALCKMCGDSVWRQVATSVKSVWKCLSAVHREVHQAHPDVDVVKGYVSVFLREVDVLRSQDTPKPCRYRGTFYDHALASHVVKDLEILKGHNLGHVHFCTRSLEHNS